MVTQIMLRTYEERLVFSESKILYVPALDLIKSDQITDNATYVRTNFWATI